LCKYFQFIFLVLFLVYTELYNGKLLLVEGLPTNPHLVYD